MVSTLGLPAVVGLNTGRNQGLFKFPMVFGQHLLHTLAENFLPIRAASRSKSFKAVRLNRVATESVINKVYKILD